jgi:hypothetical protein
VHVVDEPGGKEVADHGGTSADAYVLAARSLAGRLAGIHTTQLSDSARQIYAATYGDPPDPPATTALIEIPSSLARQSELDDVRDRS